MKNILKFASIGLLISLCVISCTDGTFEGSGGGGNLIITGLNNYNAKYISVTGTHGSTSLKFNPERIPIKSGSVSAPLYAGVGKYTDSVTGCLFTVNIYDTGNGTAVKTKVYTASIFSGSALIEWVD